MPTSLLDAVDLAALRAAAARRTGGAAALLAALLEGQALAFDPDDPAWRGGDDLVVGGQTLGGQVRAALDEVGGHPEAVAVTEPGRALALAVGGAAAGASRVGAGRTLCLLDAAAVADGRTWEGALAGAGLPGLVVLWVLAAAEVGAAERLLDAAGWPCERVAADAPVELLAGLDRALARSTAGALLLVA
ncbi:MAG: hypothetical protein ACQETV_03630 [Actinomycetota bacterium]